MPTVLLELDVEKVKRFCAKEVPASSSDEVRLEVTIRAKSVSIHERRPVWRGAPGKWTSLPIAQLRDDGDGKWTLYVSDRNGKWVLSLGLEPEQPIEVLINELNDDPTFTFWARSTRLSSDHHHDAGDCSPTRPDVSGPQTGGARAQGEKRTSRRRRAPDPGCSPTAPYYGLRSYV